MATKFRNFILAEVTGFDGMGIEMAYVKGNADQIIIEMYRIRQ